MINLISPLISLYKKTNLKKKIKYNQKNMARRQFKIKTKLHAIRAWRINKRC